MTPSLTQAHLDRIRQHFETVQPLPALARYYRKLLAHYYNLAIPKHAKVLEIGCGSGELLASLKVATPTGIDLSPSQLSSAKGRLPRSTFIERAGEHVDSSIGLYDYIIVSDTLNLSADVQELLSAARQAAHSESRLILNFHNTLWRPLLSLANRLGLRTPPPENNWLSTADVESLLELAGWEVIKVQTRIICPLPLGVVSTALNRYLAPIIPWGCMTIFITARPKPIQDDRARTVSVVIPARNEAGNIENAILRTPEMGAWTELIFVEGNSTDNTWAEIERLCELYKDRRRIKILRQSGKGKGNAVREGFAVAAGEILMILDADLTMPPEDLPKFYQAISAGACDFANGCRLVYPMESEAMRFLNLCANKSFGLLFSWLLGQRVKDTLCGTKVLSAMHYRQVADNRGYFGDFDPFGDFDLLFGADKMNLKIIDIPIRYRDRIYGETNIHRWKHGWLLLRMVVFAAKKLKFV